MRALLSVYDKTGLEAFATGLVGLGVELVASGGTAKALGAAGIAHRTVESVTQAPEMLGGRVKTLHPALHGGILANLDEPSHRDDLAAAAIEPIGLVVSNLYPFQAAPSIEMIDIGGPTMVRAAAKNYAHVGILVDPGDYGAVLDELRNDGELSAVTRLTLARKAFGHVATYDSAIVTWFDSDSGPTAAGKTAVTGGSKRDGLPPSIHVSIERAQELRYGENPHQAGARYRDAAGVAGTEGWWETVTQHGGREVSYLNLFDADSAWRLVHEIAATPGGPGTAAVIVKHANACGAAVASTIAAAYESAFEADPLSAFGGIVALSEGVDLTLAEMIVANSIADVMVAPAYTPEALELLTTRRKNMRVLEAAAPGRPGLVLRQIDGSWLVQQSDTVSLDASAWRCVTERAPAEAEWLDVKLAWLVCARTLSNTIVLAKGGQVVGVGCGQQSRVDAARIAERKAASRAVGGAGASDAYFPFRDGLDAVADSGVVVVVQPGGSMRDDEVIAAANERGIAMVMTGERHFRH